MGGGGGRATRPALDAGGRVKASHLFEALLVRALRAGVRAMPWRASLRLGAALGDLAHALGIRRTVAEGNLASAFPDRTAAERARILSAHYRQLGQIACEYARLGQLARAPEGQVIATVRGLEHLDAVRDRGRGAILLTGHYGNFELMGAWLGRRHPVDFVAKPLSNPAVDAMRIRMLAEAGVGYIPLGPGLRRVFSALRHNRWVAMVADQDARDGGVFVPFLGRPSSTPVGPAVIALRTGAPIVMGFVTRREDGRHDGEFLPPLVPPGPEAADPVYALTALHAACLEAWVREHPEMWLWLHRRWKTAPPGGVAAGEQAPARRPAAAGGGAGGR